MFVLFLASCTGKVNGTYEPSNKGIFLSHGVYSQQLIFYSDNTVQIFTKNDILEGTYTTEDNEVEIILSGKASVGIQRFTFIIDDDSCLDGGETIGKYCKK
ncbi:MAG: hypothetical protein A3F72_02565 [Bacteroidetes bacterium RIFCSPLOWO2_12_FULL_35_15]|nr:MAG: hypothetical protein A3F72_02565 [Bacteroidetes bacterium RIFCSPLOWO2_12_FULL_35_15]